MREIDIYFLEKEEPFKSCLMALRNSILTHDTTIVEIRKYGMPCYCYKNRYKLN